MRNILTFLLMILVSFNAEAATNATSSQNVGIGTSSPEQKLVVRGGNAVITGSVTAGSFSGDGSALTGISGSGSVTINTTSPMTGSGSGSSFTLGVDSTKLSGTASSLTAGTVTTNANLTGDVTSSGNATTLSSTYKGWTDVGTTVYTTTTTDAVAIGTTTPVSGAILTVNGTMAGGGSGPMAITNANVGIGTTTAGSLLTVGSTGQFAVDTSGTTRIGIGTTTAGTIICVKSISGSTAQLGYCTGSLTNSICGTCN